MDDPPIIQLFNSSSFLTFFMLIVFPWTMINIYIVYKPSINIYKPSISWITSPLSQFTQHYHARPGGPVNSRISPLVLFADRTNDPRTGPMVYPEPFFRKLPYVPRKIECSQQPDWYGSKRYASRQTPKSQWLINTQNDNLSSPPAFLLVNHEFPKHSSWISHLCRWFWDNSSLVSCQRNPMSKPSAQIMKINYPTSAE